MTSKDFFYCYNKKVSEFLTEYGVQYIVKAINPVCNRMFSMYEQSDQLGKALDKYKELSK